MGPGQFEHAVGEALILVFCDQAERRFAAVTDAVDQIHADALVRLECNLATDRHHRIEHRALAGGQHRAGLHRTWRRDAGAPADKTLTVGLVAELADRRVMHRHQVKHPGCHFVARTRAARAQDRALRSDDLSLYEQLAERRVQIVCSRWRQHDLGVTRDLERAAHSRAVGNEYPAQFDVVFG